jgi:FixJ family two-component response regulator
MRTASASRCAGSSWPKVTRYWMPVTVFRRSISFGADWARWTWVLADVVMPVMNGTELAATLLVECPDLPIILMSAYLPAGLTRVGVHQAIVPVLMKPFTGDQLEELVPVEFDVPGKHRRTSRPATTWDGLAR